MDKNYNTNNKQPVTKMTCIYMYSVHVVINKQMEKQVPSIST